MEISQLPVASTIDGVNDTLPIYTKNLNSTQQISRNTYLGLASAPVGLTDSQTLTNKILTSPTISGPTLSGTISGTYTIGGTPTFPASVTTLTGSQTLTNKTLTSPTINSPTISNATITADTITGYTTSNTGTIYGGISVSTGNVSLSGTLGVTGLLTPSGGLATNSVSAAALATNAIILGYTSVTGGDITTTAPTSATLVTGMTVTVTIPAGNRKIKVTAYARYGYGSASVGTVYSLWDGTVGSGTQIQSAQWGNATAQTQPLNMFAIVTPSAGSKTYNLGVSASSGNVITGNSSTAPAYILVEAI